MLDRRRVSFYGRFMIPDQRTTAFCFGSTLFIGETSHKKYTHTPGKCTSRWCVLYKMWSVFCVFVYSLGCRTYEKSRIDMTGSRRWNLRRKSNYKSPLFSGQMARKSIRDRINKNTHWYMVYRIKCRVFWRNQEFLIIRPCYVCTRQNMRYNETESFQNYDKLNNINSENIIN